MNDLIMVGDHSGEANGYLFRLYRPIFGLPEPLQPVSSP